MGDRHLHPGGENEMKITAAVLCIVGSTISIGANAADSLDFLKGEWSGSGTMFGSDASIRQSWRPALNGAFTTLHLRVRIAGENGTNLVFEGTGYYQELPDETLSGVWLDSNGDLYPLQATVESKTLTVLWGNEETESGRSSYQLLEDGSLKVVDSVAEEDGNLRDFAYAALSRRTTNNEESKMAKVTGIGGVFMLARNDGKTLSQWYHKNLGMQPEDFGGVVLQWEEDTANDKGLTVWHIADKDSKWFSPSDSRFMINYRVDNLDEMITQLKTGGVEILQGPETHENGKFAWIMDPEGNKIELWEPMLWDDANKQ